MCSCWHGFSVETFGVFGHEILATGRRNPAACRDRRLAARRSPAADYRVPPAGPAAAWIAQTMIDDSPPRDAAACGWPAVRFRDGRSPAPGLRSDRSEERRVGKECRSGWAPDA